MQRFALLTVVLALLIGCGGGGSEEAPPPDDSAFASSARVATNRLRVALQSELRAAMQAGGPLAAIEVCNTRAPEIAAEVSAGAGFEVGRVSTRHRNPANAPDPTETAVLAAFEARPALQDTVVRVDGRPVYLRAIRIDNPVCLNCHGPSEGLDPELRATIASLYPDDRATGFAEGDLRGAFVVR